MTGRAVTNHETLNRDGLEKRLVEEFDGKFTDEFLELLIRKRRSIELPLETICEVIGVNASTFRKWLDGEITVCRLHNVNIVKRFVNGDFDEALRAKLRNGFIQEKQVVTQMKAHFHNLIAILSLTNEHPEREQRILSDFLAFCSKCRREFVESIDDDAIRQ